MESLRKEKKYILIYGAHLVALEYYRELCAEGIGEKVIGFAVCDIRDNPSHIDGLPVKNIKEYADHIADSEVVVAIPSKHHRDVEHALRELGFEHIKKVSLEELSVIKGNRLIDKYCSMLPFEISQSDNDPSWLDCYISLEHNKVKCKFPTLFYLDDISLIELSHDISKAYQDEILGISDLSSMKIDHDINDNCDVMNLMQVYMVFDKSVFHFVENMEYSSWIMPLLAGGRKKEIAPKSFSDDEWADNISNNNCILAEMTGAYWIWKQVHKPKYKGLCHYRRHFMINEEFIRSMESSNIDVLLSTPRFVPGGIKGMFEAETPVKEAVFENMLSAIDDVAKNDRVPFEDYLDKNFYFPNNMVIADSKIYDNYCSWIFPILQRMMEIDLDTSYGHEKDRHIAYASELLTSYYFITKKNKMNIAYTDYKFYG